MRIAGVDIGNSTTEVALAVYDAAAVAPRFIGSSRVPTTGIKGTLANIPGVIHALEVAIAEAKIKLSDIDLVLLNEATPVIGDIAMEAITETIVTESSMIGHNPNSPGGIGVGVGVTVPIDSLESMVAEQAMIAVIPRSCGFSQAARLITDAMNKGKQIQGAIVQADDGVLIANRLPRNIPIVDEVQMIERVPIGMLAAVEVAEQGQAIRQLSNPYGIATLFTLSPEQTTAVIPVSRALIGLRSAVVIRTPAGDVETRHIPAGSLKLLGATRNLSVDIESGAGAIMSALAEVAPLRDVEGASGTNVGGMVARVRQTMSHVTDKPASEIAIRDILAVDCVIPQRVSGGVAQEFSLESAVGLAAMVNTNRLLMDRLAKELNLKLGVKVAIGGIEANMGILGALTTPGISTPLAILDLGAGSTDAAILEVAQPVRSVHLAGAGDMVTMLIKRELDLGMSTEFDVAELVKRFPLAKVESLFHIRHEDNSVRFYKEPLDPKLFGHVVLLADHGLLPIPTRHSMDRIRTVRREAKRRVFLTNALRALNEVAPGHNIRSLRFVAVVGGSGLDFEIARMLTDWLTPYGIVIGTANIRGRLGPVNAVATGLVCNFVEQAKAKAA